MKKNFLVLIGLFAVNIINAQIFVGLHSGYGLGIQGRTLGDFFLVNGTSSLTTSENIVTAVHSSFGGGFKIGPVIGYQLNSYVGLEIGFDYHRTNRISTAWKNGNAQITKISLIGNIVSFNPNVLFTISRNHPKVYSKIGALYSVGNFKFGLSETSKSNTYASSYLINKGNAFGVLFSVGSEWEIFKHWSLRTELEYVASNYYPGKSELIKNEENGTDKLSSIPYDDRIITYSKTGHSDGEYFGSAFGRGTVVRPQIPLNGVGISIGLIHTFRRK